MMPWGHFVVGYVPYAVYRLYRDGRLPRRDAFLVLLFATQFPDLVDKPLAWTFGVLPSGRLLAHSIVIAVPLALFVVPVTWELGRPDLGGAFVLGHLSHIAADSYPLLYLGADYYFLPNLLWPLFPANPDPDPGFLVHLARVRPTPFATASLLLFAFAWLLAQPRPQRELFE